MELENEYTDRCISSTAEQVASAQPERPAQTEGVKYTLVGGMIRDGNPEDPIGRVAWPEKQERAAEMIRRANALPATEARLKEAVELLRDGLPWMDGYCKTFPASWGRIENWLNDSRTFLAKGDA